MLTVVLVVLALAGAWALLSVSVAFLAGGMIHARDHHDAPYGGFSGPSGAPASGARASAGRTVARLLPARPGR